MEDKVWFLFIGPESGLWQCLSLTHWLTNSLTHTDSRLVNLIDVTLACEDGNSKLVVTVWLCLSLTDWLTDSLTDSCLVDLMMRIVSATVCCKFGNWGMVIKLNFCSDFEHKVWSRLWSWSSGKICMVKKIFNVGKQADKAVDIGYPCHSLIHLLRH